MAENAGSGDRLTYFLIGAGIGAALALLFAPKSGREFRSDIAEMTRKTVRRGGEAAHAVGGKVSEGLSAVKEGLERQKSQIAHAVEAGKQAYREERGRSES